jgi:hypothetical protein
MNIQEVQRKARFGHRNWLMWQGEAAPLNAESLKRALLASGTQKHFYMIEANTGVGYILRWPEGVRMWRNALRGWQ